MLSRIAESLFWIGRYVERSDGTARILDVHLQLLLEDPWIDEDTACRSLLSVMGTDLPRQVGAREDVINDLAWMSAPGIDRLCLGARENTSRSRNCFNGIVGGLNSITHVSKVAAKRPTLLPLGPRASSAGYRWTPATSRRHGSSSRSVVPSSVQI
jgi:hypothetical protein